MAKIYQFINQICAAASLNERQDLAKTLAARSQERAQLWMMNYSSGTPQPESDEELKEREPPQKRSKLSKTDKADTATGEGSSHNHKRNHEPGPSMPPISSTVKGDAKQEVNPAPPAPSTVEEDARPEAKKDNANDPKSGPPVPPVSNTTEEDAEQEAEKNDVNNPESGPSVPSAPSTTQEDAKQEKKDDKHSPESGPAVPRASNAVKEDVKQEAKKDDGVEEDQKDPQAEKVK